MGRAPEHRCMTDWARTNLVCSDRLHRSDRSQQRLAQSHPPRQEYHIKNKEEDVQPMQVDSGKTTTDDVIKIGDVNVVVKNVGKKPMVFGKSAQTDPQKCVLANDHEASSSGSASKYHQPMCCPPGLSHSQKRRFQRLRRQEQKEREAEKLRDEHFNNAGQWFLKVKSGGSSPLSSQQDRSNHPR